MWSYIFRNFVKNKFNDFSSFEFVITFVLSLGSKEHNLRKKNCSSYRNSVVSMFFLFPKVFSPALRGLTLGRFKKKEILHNKLSSTWGWAEVRAMALTTQILNRRVWPERFSLAILLVDISSTSKRMRRLKESEGISIFKYGIIEPAFLSCLFWPMILYLSRPTTHSAFQPCLAGSRL
jgi:hypothetical protein